MKTIDETSMRLENMELLLKSIDYQLGKMLQVLSASQKNVEENKAITCSKIPEMLSVRESSKRTGLSYDYLRKQCLKGNLKHIRLGTGKFLINYDSLVDQMNSAHGYFQKQEKEEQQDV